MIEWRPVVGFEDRYEVSSEGEVRTKPRTVTRGFATVTLESKVLAQAAGGGASGAYQRVMLMGDRRKRHAYVHAVVAEAFLGPRPDGCVVCHKNDTGHDNRVANLYYGTKEDNLCDRYVNSLDLKSLEEAPF